MGAKRKIPHLQKAFQSSFPDSLAINLSLACYAAVSSQHLLTQGQNKKNVDIVSVCVRFSGCDSVC